MSCIVCNGENESTNTFLVDLIEFARSNDYLLSLTVGKDFISAHINMEEAKGKKKEA